MDQELVSIVVITYNSEKYILETLQSCANQSYSNVELIISDDSSTDSTVAICKQWVEAHHERFCRTEIITVNKNTGISDNCNRGLKASRGAWFKVIAGDDILMPSCIFNFMQKAKNVDENCAVIESKAVYFKVREGLREEYYVHDRSEEAFFSWSPDQQYHRLLRENLIDAPSAFIRKLAVESVGGFVSHYKVLEDHPMWLLLTNSGWSIRFGNFKSVLYRTHDASVFRTVRDKSFFSDFYLKRREFDVEMRLPYLNILERLRVNYNHYSLKYIDDLNANRRDCAWCRLLFYFLHPNEYLRKLKL